MSSTRCQRLENPNAPQRRTPRAGLLCSCVQCIELTAFAYRLSCAFQALMNNTSPLAILQPGFNACEPPNVHKSASFAPGVGVQFQ